MKLLSLANNGIATINKDTFLGILNLESLDMSGNKLTGIATEFVLPPAADIILLNCDIKLISGPLLIKSSNQRIDLSFNNLSVLHPLAFVNMNKTTEIVLSTNSLKSDYTCGSVWETLIFLRTLNLNNNSITFIPAFCFLSLKSLMVLKLQHNNIHKVDNNGFEGLQNVKSLDLQDNELKVVWNKSFYGLFNLTQLILNRNKISAIQFGSFISTRNLEMLLLVSNALQTSDICHLVWQPLIKLRVLNLGNNRILTLKSGCFRYLVSLRNLILPHNNISNLENNSFKGLANLRELNLRDNKLQLIMNGSLAGLHKLEYLRLENNEIHILQAGSFHFMKQLRLIQLKGNLLMTILEDTFPSNLRNKLNIILDQNPFVCSCNMSWLQENHFSLSAKSVCKWNRNIYETSTLNLNQFVAGQCSDWYSTTSLPANDPDRPTYNMKYNPILLASLAVLALLVIVATTTVIVFILKKGRNSLVCKGDSSQ